MPISTRGILLCIVSLLLFACTFPSPPPQIGDRAPSFALEDINGRTVRLEDLRGKVILVHFWSIHCPPCREELPLFAALPSILGDLPVVIVPISADEGGRGAVIAYLNASGISLP
ncbi:MAG TPA: TlpA disulfide reductase family protein, partial [Geobacterales bacterium]|nr:TlpA disulfide reductase family protein [Geobacterales bacterium]